MSTKSPATASSSPPEQKEEQEEGFIEHLSRATYAINGPLWQSNIEQNRVLMADDFSRTVDLLSGRGRGKKKKAIVVGGGPSIKEALVLDKLKRLKEKKEIVLIACDGALPYLDDVACYPDYVVTVDGSPIVSKFYRQLSRRMRPRALFSTTVHPSVLKEVKNRYWPLYWWQPRWAESDEDNDHHPLHLPGILSVHTGGNVGSTCWVMAACLLRCSPVGLLAIEFAWSDETPYSETQYWKHLVRALGDERRAREHYVTIRNPRDGKSYIADPVYYAYSIMFKQMLNAAPKDVSSNTFTLTKQGILHGEGAPEYMDIQRFLEL